MFGDPRYSKLINDRPVNVAVFLCKESDTPVKWFLAMAPNNAVVYYTKTGGSTSVFSQLDVLWPGGLSFNQVNYWVPPVLAEATRVRLAALQEDLPPTTVSHGRQFLP